MGRRTIAKTEVLATPITTSYVCRLHAVEYSPQTRTINFSNSHHGKDGVVQKYTISLPYIQFYLIDPIDSIEPIDGVRGLYLTMSFEPLSSIGSRVFTPALPNVMSNNQACLWQSVQDYIDKSKTLTSLDEYITRFWNSVFTNDGCYGEALLGINHNGKSIGTIDRWAKLSQSDPDFIKNCQIHSISVSGPLWAKTFGGYRPKNADFGF